MKEGQANTIPLPEQDPKIFSTYLQWLYTGELVAVDKETPSPEDERKERLSFCNASLSVLISLYLMADMLLDTRMQNAVSDDLLASTKATKFAPRLGHVNRIYETTRQGCVLRRLAVDLFATCVAQSRFVTHGQQYPTQFLSDLVVRLMAMREAGRRVTDPYNAAKCFYHDHDEANPTCE